jgi:biopolymer transport protein TolR
MRNRSKKRKPIAEINVVPYIDVMLVLLIIFIVTAPLITQGVHVDLPQGQAKNLEQAKPPIIATVDHQGLYYLSAQGEDKNQNLSLSELAHHIAALLTLEPQRQVVVRGDKLVTYDKVVQLMMTLQSAGVNSVGLMTDNTYEN